MFAFYAEVYAGAAWLQDPTRFEWQTFLNPYLDDGQSEIWLLRDESDRLIGQNIYIPYPLRIGELSAIGYCSTNLIVRPEYVGKGLGHKLVETNEQRPGVPYAIGITRASERAFLKRGWVLVEDTRLYAKVIRPTRFCAFLNLTGPKKALAIVALVMSKLAGQIVSAFRSKQDSQFEFDRVDRFDQRDDRHWQAYLGSFAIHFERTARMLNYKYVDRPGVEHAMILCRAHGNVAGYAVYRVSRHPLSGLHLGRIVDIVVDPTYGRRLLRSLLAYISQEFAGHGVDGLVCMGSSKALVGALHDNGFFLSRPQHAIIREKGFAVADLRQKYPHLWYITLGDSDLDNYW